MSNYYSNYINVINRKFSDFSKKIKVVAKIILIVGVLAGIILGIVMFSKSGTSKDTFLIGNASSEFFNWLGFGFLLGLPSLSLVLFFLLYGLGEVLETLKKNGEGSSAVHTVPEKRISKAKVAANEYGLYCSYCNNYINNGDHECSRCHSVLVYDDHPQSRIEEDNNPLKTAASSENIYTHYSKSNSGNTERYCPKCGATLKSDSVFCFKCGTKVEQE